MLYTNNCERLELLYSGECHTFNGTIDLKIRITQYFIPGNNMGITL